MKRILSLVMIGLTGCASIPNTNHRPVSQDSGAINTDLSPKSAETNSAPKEVVKLDPELRLYWLTLNLEDKNSHWSPGERVEWERQAETIRSGLFTEYFQANPNLNPDIRYAIQHKEIAVGITPYQVRLSIGLPHHTNLSGGKYGKHEQWVYPGRRTYLYFEEDRLTSWQLNNE